MELVQDAILKLQDALQKRSSCDASTQTVAEDDEPLKGLLPYEYMDLMKRHIKLANDYMALHSEETQGCEINNPPWSGSTYQDKLVSQELVSSNSDISDVSDNEDDTAANAIMQEGRSKKKRKRESGASDDQSFVMERHNRVYLAFKPGDKSWRFKYVLKDKGESWDHADSAIMQKMQSVCKNGKNASNVFTEREKLVQLWCDQNKVTYKEGELYLDGVTNLEIFCQIKKNSPGLIKSGIPNQTEELERQ